MLVQNNPIQNVNGQKTEIHIIDFITANELRQQESEIQIYSHKELTMRKNIRSSGLRKSAKYGGV